MKINLGMKGAGGSLADMPQVTEAQDLGYSGPTMAMPTVPEVRYDALFATRDPNSNIPAGAQGTPMRISRWGQERLPLGDYRVNMSNKMGNDPAGE